ncbi:MAG: hypothetical protein CL610_10585 [Anaerolineaceae bacterium]|nr:hypothetical protein [Anaerolineaceae bacterium]
MMLTREINRLVTAVFIIFGIITLAAAYWATIGPGTILEREDNPRLVEAEAAIRRGGIFDRSGDQLAISVVDENNRVTREYFYPETSSILGYSSLRYGVSGAESAYNPIIRGDNAEQSVVEQLLQNALHQPQVGSDIQLSLDLQIQQALQASMDGYVGAAVVLAVPSGEVLGLISLPTFDPNTLDQNWELLVASADKPFFNRVLQGQYQPGGTLETPLMALALATDSNLLASTTANATAPVTINDLTITCALRLPALELSLRDAYAFACPAPFVQLTQDLPEQSVQDSLRFFSTSNRVTLPGFESAPLNPPVNLPAGVEPHSLAEVALGQAQLTVTPLQMAVMAAGIINDGNAPQPRALLATRPPDASNWTPNQTTYPTIPFTTEQTARQLQDLMRNTVVNGAALNAARPGIDIGGHVTLSYSGDETQSWFIGFATLPGRRGIATAVIIENNDDPGLAADIGGTILAAAHDELIQAAR